jgi:hypothetical protein
MIMAYRGEGDAQPADSDHGQVGVVHVTDTRVVGNSVTVIVAPLVAIDTSLSARDAGRAWPGSPGVGGCCFGYNP